MYLQSLGYAIRCSDTIPGFVETLQKAGLDAFLFNSLRDEYPPNLFDLVFTDTALLRFTAKKNFQYSIQKIYHVDEDASLSKKKTTLTQFDIPTVKM